MIEHKYSTFTPRFCAGFLDTIIFWPVWWLCSFSYSHSSSVWIQVLVFTIDSCAFVVYSVWMHGKFGQTLGKMACKVVVLDVSERALSMKQAVLRDILSVILVPVSLAIDIPRIIRGVDVYTPQTVTLIDSIMTYSALGWFLVEIITMLTNNKRRALHDFIAGSVVVRKTNKLSEPSAAGFYTVLQKKVSRCMLC